jgi:tRNA-dihydrouridine synthase B
MRIGSHFLCGRLIAASMAGVTDRPFRVLCRRPDASCIVSKLLSSNPAARNTRKTPQRSNHVGEPEPCWIQVAGADPKEMARAARANVDLVGRIIDINKGCPAKKVCDGAAGSALLTGDNPGMRIARKPFGWYLRKQANVPQMWARVNRVATPPTRFSLFRAFFAAPRQSPLILNPAA